MRLMHFPEHMHARKRWSVPSDKPLGVSWELANATVSEGSGSAGVDQQHDSAADRWGSGHVIFDANAVAESKARCKRLE